MGKEQKHPLRALTPQEEQELQRIAKATSERLDVVKRARALLSVQAGLSFTDAAGKAGYKSGDSISQLVERFNRQGLEALLIAPGRGRKPTYTSEQRARIVAEIQREPDRQADQTATWSLMLLRQALRKTELPHVAKETIRVTLHEVGYAFGKTRTWCPTGTALRKRKAGIVTVQDPAAPEKKDSSSKRTSRRKQLDWNCGMRMKRGRIKLFPSQARTGTLWASPVVCLTSISAGARPNCSPSFVQPPAWCAPRECGQHPMWF